MREDYETWSRISLDIGEVYASLSENQAICDVQPKWPKTRKMLLTKPDCVIHIMRMPFRFQEMSQAGTKGL